MVSEILGFYEIKGWGMALGSPQLVSLDVS